jgi:hypothetical protein
VIAPGDNADEIDAQADELEATEIVRSAAVQAEVLRLRARAKRMRVETRAEILPAPEHMTRAQYAHRSSVSVVTVARWIKEGMPVIPIGTTDRIDPSAADAWRKARPRTATTPIRKVTPKDDVDVSSVLAIANVRKRA